VKTRRLIPVALVAASTLISAMLSSAQDAAIGDVARAARAERSQTPRAGKVVTDDDLAPQLQPVSATDDPKQVLERANHAWLTVLPRTCHNVGSSNNGPGSSDDILTETAAPDRGRIVMNLQGGLDPGRRELIVIGNDMYSRRGTGPWRKDTAEGSLAGTVRMNRLPDELTYSYGTLKLIRRDVIEGSPTFQYEVKFHPGGDETRERTIDFWVGANDNLLRRIDVLNQEMPPSPQAGIKRGGTTTCSYGPVPEIKPPI
jgi:hypothetical protein